MHCVSENLFPLLKSNGGEGHVLLLLHLYPLFQHPETGFEVVQSHLDVLRQFMSKPQMERIFTPVLLHFYDSPLEPHQQGFLLSRSMADLLIRCFGIRSFLLRYLEFFLNAVLEPETLSSRGSSRRRAAFRLRESDSILTLIQSELVQSRKYEESARQSRVSDLTFSVDLKDPGAYNSDKEYSSSDSESEYPPEASLLAHSGMVLSSLSEVGGGGRLDLEGGLPGGEGIGGRMGEDDVLSPFANDERGEGTDLQRTMLFSQYPMESNLDASQTTARTDEMEQSSGMIPLRIDTAPSEFRAPYDSPGGKSALAASIRSSALEDSTQFPFSNRQTSPELSSLPYASLKGSLLMQLKSTTLHHTKAYSTQSRGDTESGGEKERARERDRKEEEEEEEEVEEEEKRAARTEDPQAAAINQQISEVARDTLCWLQRRLGPLLATRHITKALLSGMHRCFTGVVGCQGMGVGVLRCLTAMAALYGDDILLKLYLPQTESWVSVGR